MRRRDDETSPDQDWLPWLRTVVRRRGYDLEGGPRGELTRLAADTHLPQPTISRLMQGVAPSYETCVALSRSLDIPLETLLIRTGKAVASDFSREAGDADPTEVVSGKPLSPAEVAAAVGVPEEDRDWFETMIKRFRRQGGGTDGTVGGAAAER